MSLFVFYDLLLLKLPHLIELHSKLIANVKAYRKKNIKFNYLKKVSN